MTDWPAYVEQCRAAFLARTSLSGERIGTRVWRDCFIRSIPPEEAASRAETAYVNGLREKDRLAYYAARDLLRRT